MIKYAFGVNLFNNKFILIIILLLLADLTFSKEIPSLASLKIKEANAEVVEDKPKKREDSIPVIEIRGEGKPMSAAQIRELEEMSNGGPLDIKVSKTWVPGDCPRKARRLDFVTFHFKGFSEAGKKFDQSYGRENDGIKIQLGVGMTMPGLDKGIKGMCDVWRFIPNDEHWLRFDVEAIKIEPWTIEGQFEWMDLNNDSKLTEDELTRFGYKMLKEFGKAWPNEDIDPVLASKYYIKYFDANNDGIIDISEFKYIFERDLSIIEKNGVHNIDIIQNGDPFKEILLHGSRKLLDQLDARSQQIIDGILYNGKKFIHDVYNYRDMIYVSTITLGDFTKEDISFFVTN
uniref:peptidylprolyl isomerase n=1 Tax=Meloidogyne javanica TaxID=6303 RepID=A0A915LVB3_MELJA